MPSNILKQGLRTMTVAAQNRLTRNWVIFMLLALSSFAHPQEPEKVSKNIFPIMNYDSDTGFGFGMKGLIRNHFGSDESLDLILYGSSKGENWAQFTFAIPDFEIRQGTVFPWAVDLRLEFNKQLKTNFMGFGNESKDNDLQFPRESAKADISLSRAFLPELIASATLRYAHYTSYNFDPAWGTILASTPGAGESQVAMALIMLRFDARDSQIHPTRGVLAEAEGGNAFRALGGDWRFARYQLKLSAYQHLFSKSHILAVRHWIQHVDGIAPYMEQARLGNSWTLRGYKAERFIDKAMVLSSAEYRFPLWKSLGSVLFLDAGRVWSGIEKYSFTGWHGNRGFGLRYYLTTFVVRFDIGKSKEGTRVFFNFSHVF